MTSQTHHTTNTRKRVAGAAICALLAIPLVSVTTSQVAHASCTDSSFSFSWPIISDTQYTPARYKDNTSYVYLNAQYNEAGRTYVAWASAYSNGSYIDVSDGHSYEIRQGNTYTLTNYVREWGYTQASIGARKIGPIGLKANGLWSPDYC